MPLHEIISPASVLIGRETVNIDGKPVKIFTYIEKRNGCRASIGSKGVHIRLAKWMGKAEQKQQYEQLKQWAIGHLNKHKAVFLQSGGRLYEHNGTFDIAGRSFTIKKIYKDGSSSKGRLKNETMFLYLATGMNEQEEREHSSYLVSRLIGNAFLPEVRQRLEELNTLHFKRAIGRVRLRNNSSNWGSCSHNGNISISTRLLFAPFDTVDYVLIHELAHLVEHNHGDRFWKLVEQAMPDYRRHEKWLDKNGHLCQF
jgi:predicted metal-dependent hydrolase